MPAPPIEELPVDLITHVTYICGARGRAWFDALPRIVRELEETWKVVVGKPFPGIEFNFVAEAVDELGRPVVVKIAPPFETPEIFAEARFLRNLNGAGAVNLLAEDRGRQAILLERALPGEALHERFAATPSDCVVPAIEVLKRIFRPPPANRSGIPTLDGWFAKFQHFRGTAFPASMAERAIGLYERLSSRPGSRGYIHGDFHPGNIVTATREDFQVIDPKGIIGCVGYDIAVFLINLERWQRGDPAVEALLAAAVSNFAAAFDMTEREVREWVFIHMVIGAWWNFEDMPDLYDPELAMPAIWHL